ncbi:hypothetical protein SNEBB_006081, partial [Seison nebaliae]
QPKTLLEYKDFFKRGFQYGGDLFINKLFMPHVPAEKWKNFYDTLSGETGVPPNFYKQLSPPVSLLDQIWLPYTNLLKQEDKIPFDAMSIDISNTLINRKYRHLNDKEEEKDIIEEAVGKLKRMKGSFDGRFLLVINN